MLYTLMMRYSFLKKSYFNKVPFIASQRYILAVGLDKINLDEDNHFNEDDNNPIISVRFFAWHSKSEKYKALIER